ncbi:VOC family protein [Limibacter armeniacum]|uniref:VOC family protein n=1 Tax=Limibacter armeniacum TaxID=466084 RepID=UPI002FE54580
MHFKQITETCLYVKDLTLTEDFYHNKLGLPIISTVANRHIFFRAGTSVLLCFIAEVTRQEETLPPHYGSGKIHMAFEANEGDYDAWKDKVSNAGIHITHEQVWPWSHNRKSFYFEDPDGHVLEIIESNLWNS